MKHIHIPIISFMLLMSCGGMLSAQQPNYTLTTNESGATKEFVARDFVSMKPGFSFTATATNTFNARIDEKLIFPPAENYLKPDGTITTDPSQGSVVGSIPGQFAVSPTGAATYTIPIECPPGINGMQPNMAISYSSLAGYGALGTGWNISGVSAITRGGKNLYYDGNTEGLKFDNSDPIYLDGKRLIKLSGTDFSVGAIYATEIEDNTRVEILANSDNSIYFVVTTVDGRIMEYGKTRDSQIRSVGDITKIVSWKINIITDTYGNSIFFTYNSVLNNGRPTTIISDHQLSKIEYAGNSISLDYNKNKTYTHEIYVKDILLTQSELLEYITVKNGDNLISKYEFIYNDEDKLQEVKLNDGNGAFVNSSKVQWGVSSQPEFKVIGNIADSNLDNIEKGQSSVDFADINGDGYSDRIERWVGNSNESGFLKVYFYSKTNKTYSSTVSVSLTLPYYDYEKFHPQVFYADINRDGKEEIILTDNNRLFAYNYTSGSLLTCFTDGRSNFDTRQHIEDYFKDKMVKLTSHDINHDGVNDLIIGYYNKGGNGHFGYAIFFGSQGGLTVNPAFHKENKAYTFDNFEFGDFNADGKLEMLFLSSKDVPTSVKTEGEVIDTEYITLSTTKNYSQDYYYDKKPTDFKITDIDNDGRSKLLYYSSEDKKWRLDYTLGRSLSPSPLAEVLPFEGENCKFIDINGDGALDVVKYEDHFGEPVVVGTSFFPTPTIVYASKYEYTEWTVYINKGNGEFSASQKINFNTFKNEYSEYSILYFDMNGSIIGGDISSQDDMFHRQLFTNSDINGDGISDLIVVQEGVMYALTIPQINRKNLVIGVTNGMGQKESVTYKNLSDYEPYSTTEASAKIRPLRGPLLVADTHTHIDGSKTVYSFESPKYADGKGLIGFATIKTSNSDNNVQTVSEYEFNQTFFFPALKSQSTSTIGGDKDISYSSLTNNVKVISSSLKRYIPYVSVQNNIDVLKNLNQTVTTNYDDYPNSLTQTTVEGDLITTTKTTFTGPPNKTKYLPQTVVSTRTQKGQSFTKKTNYSYVFDGTNPYRIIGKTETVDPDDVNSVSTTYSNFDKWGHPQDITISSGNTSRSSSVKYFNNSTTETHAGLYLRSKTNALGKKTTYTWNESSGLLDSETDARGNTTSYIYTYFGKLKETRYPDGTRNVSILQWAEAGDVNSARYYTYTETSGSAPIITWYDALGRDIQTDTYGLNEKKISVSTEYYAENNFALGKRKGMVHRISEPYFEADAGNKVWAKTLTYDQFGRTVKAVIPMGELSNVYNGRITTTKNPESTTVTTLNSAGQVVSSSVNGKAVTYEYHPSGLVSKSTPQGGEPINIKYNQQGNQIRIEDPNSGTTRSEYNGFGELTLSVKRVHAQGDSIRTIYTYKKDGRLESINRNGEITTYAYNTTLNYQNQLKEVELKNKNGQIQNKQSLTYDPVKFADRITELKKEIIDNTGNLKQFIKRTEYDALGRISKTVFPSGYYLQNKYDRYGNLTDRKDGAGRLIWKAIDENAKGQLMHVVKGKKTTEYEYYANGQTKEIKADSVVDLYYVYDPQTHNLHSREDKLTSQLETFGYDGLNRLKDWTVSRNGTNTTHSIIYDNTYGTIKSKSDLGAFTFKYGGEKEDGTKVGIAGGELSAPHALTSIIPNQGTTGLPNNFPSADLSVTYTDFKKIATLTEASKFYRITYGTDDERIKSVYYATGQTQGAPTLTRYYAGDYEEEIDASGKTKKIHYLSGAIYIEISTSAGEPAGALYYAYADYQGSLTALTDEAGNVVERYANDPWGARRNPQDWTQKDTRTTWIVNRGYTGHEHLDAFSIINMNGRVYDPLTAQFFSPDPVLTDAGNWLDYNRYGYCLNNPFRYTDPSGYTWWAENGGKVLSAGASIVVGAVVGIATGGTGVPAMIASGMASGAAGGFAGGAVYVAATGGSFGEAMGAGLQGAVIGGMMGGASVGFPAGVGAAFGHTVGGFGRELLRAGAHGTFNGLLNMAQGGSFGGGFAIGALSSLAGSIIPNSPYLPFVTGAVGAGTAWAFGENPMSGFSQGFAIGTLNHSWKGADGREVPHFHEADGTIFDLREHTFSTLVVTPNNAFVEASILLGALGSLGNFGERSKATFRLTNGNYNGNVFSPKIYPKGWNGGSVADITTYKLSSLGKGLSTGAAVFSTGISYYEIGTGNARPITYVDAGVGTVGLGASASSYFWGVQIPVVGEVVALYGWTRLWMDLGAIYGPSKWYGPDDTKWFK